MDDIEKYKGVSIKNLPKDIKRDDLFQFLLDAGLPESFENKNIKLGDHGNVDISEVDKDDCITIVMNLHKKKFFERKLYCRPIIGLSPIKSNNTPKEGEKEEEKEEETLDEAPEQRIVSKLLGYGTENESDVETEDEIETRRKEFLKGSKTDEFKEVKNKRKQISPGKSAEKPNEKKSKAEKAKEEKTEKPVQHKFKFKKLNKN